MTSSPRIRFHFTDPDSQPSWISLTSNEAGKRQSYFLYRDESNSLQINSGNNGLYGYDRPVLLAVIHVEDSGIFVEAVYSSKEPPYITQDLSSSIKRRIPLSHPPKEHMLVLLDHSGFLSIDGEKIQLDLGDLPIGATECPPLSLTAQVDQEGDIPMGIDDDPQIQVEQSMQDPVVATAQHGGGRESHRYSTPVIPETNPEEAIVAETPFKSRFFNPMSPGRTPKVQEPHVSLGDESLPPGNQSASKKFLTKISESGLIFASSNGRNPDEAATSSPPVDDGELGTSDEENELARYLSLESEGKPESTSLEPGSITATPGKAIPKGKGLETMGAAFSDLTSLGEPDDEKENRHESPPSLESVSALGVRKPSMDDSAEFAQEPGGGEHRVHTAKTNEPLPEAFLYEEHMKSTTPGRTYSRKKGLVKSPLNKKSPDKSPTDRKGTGLHDGDIGKNVPTPLRREKRKAPESPDDVASKGEGNKKDTSGKDTNKRRKAEPKLQHTPMKGTVVSEEITPARRGLRGRKIVQSQSEDSGDEVQEAVTESTRQREVAQELQEQQTEEPSVEEKETGLALTTKTPKRRGRKKLSDEEVNIGVAPEESPALEAHQESEERAVTPGAGPSTRGTTGEPETGKPESKRTKQTPARTGSRRTRKSLAASPPAETLQKEVGDTQYTVPLETQTQTQTMDRVEVKTPKSVGKKATAKAKKPPARMRGSGLRKQSEEASLNDEEEINEESAINVRTRERYEGDAPKIVFSNSGLDGKKDVERFLRTTGAKRMDNASTPGVNFLVVGPGELKRTPKLTVGVALGKTVVEDQWLLDSKEIGYFLDPDQYIPNDPLHEKEWGFNLAAAIERGREGKNSVLKGWNVNVTSTLISQLKAGGQEESLAEMLKAAGAGNIVKKAPRGNKKDKEKTLVLGSEKGDGEISVLEKSGWAIFSTGIIALSVLRGRLDTDADEFRIKSDDDMSSGATAPTQRPRRKVK